MSVESRCPSCGALVSSDAEWCGQCFSPLSEKSPEGDRPESDAAHEPPTDRVPRADRRSASNVVPLERGGRAPTWPCPSCGNDNAIELNSCAVCGTAFARLFEQERVAPDVEPATALLWSALLPGLGHWKLGRRLDGVARMVVFVWTAGTTLLLLLSRSGKSGLGSLASLVILFFGSAAIVYLLSALDSYRIGSGDTPVVSARMLLWGCAALVLLSTILATIIAFPAARGH